MNFVLINRPDRQLALVVARQFVTVAAISPDPEEILGPFRLRTNEFHRNSLLVPDGLWLFP